MEECFLAEFEEELECAVRQRLTGLRQEVENAVSVCCFDPFALTYGYILIKYETSGYCSPGAEISRVNFSVTKGPVYSVCIHIAMAKYTWLHLIALISFFFTSFLSRFPLFAFMFLFFYNLVSH